MAETPDRTTASRGKYLRKLKIPRFACPKFKPKPKCEQSDTLPVAPEIPLSFGEMLDQKFLAEASRGLIYLEDQLCGGWSEEPDPGTPDLVSHGGSGGSGQEDEVGEDKEDILQKDLEALLVHVWMAIHSTFTSTSASSQEDLQLLQSAVSVIRQQEAQDKRWEEWEKDVEHGGGSDAAGGGGGGGGRRGGARCPVWRPVECLHTHRKLLAAMVDSRLRSATLLDNDGATSLSSATKRELCGVGKRLKEDLLVVARKASHCYPEEWDIPRVYASLYHHGFASRLTELARSGLTVDECSYLLFWVNDYYPKEILKHEELQAVFTSTELGALVPQEELNRLEDQYLTHKEGQVGVWLGSALAREQESWQRGPEKIDLYWFSSLAVDTLQVVNSVLSEVRSVLSDQSKAQRITAQLQPFLTSYRKALEDFTKRNHDNSPAVMKANLVCIQQLRSFLEKEDFLSGDQRARLGSSVRALEDWGYSVLTSPIHMEMKTQYRLLWSGSWLARGGCVLDGLLDSLDRQLHLLTDLKPACKEVLLGKLHEEVLAEYVRRLMKGKVIMRSRAEEEEAATLLCDHGNKIHGFFSEEGSPRTELRPLLSTLSELLRLQDRESLQLEVASMAMQYPGLRSSHVAALMSLRNSLSAADSRFIKQIVQDTQQPATNHNAFFSRVPVKWINKMKP